jgi:hypothetical protein
MNNKEITEKIIQKKEFSKLPKKDVEKAFGHFEKRQVSDEEKIRLTRELLHKVFGAFTSKKILSPKNKDAGWVLRKHLSTRERLPFYDELYKKLLKNFNGVVFDLGAGINGFSYNSFPIKFRYIGVEAVGQLVDLMNSYFEKEKINASAIHLSLFETEKLKEVIQREKGKKIVFLFKTLDSLEMLERDYSKCLLKEIVPLVEEVVISFATKSMISRKKFKVKRNWIVDFIKENFTVLDNFELGGERYLVFRKI